MAVVPLVKPKEVFPSLFDTYFEYVKDTESPIIYHRWSLITAVSAFLGRSYWLPHGSNRVFPTMYTMLVGHPGTRKSSAIKTAKKLISAAGYSTFAANKTSKEKFLLDLEGETDDNATWQGKRGKNGRDDTVTAADVLANLNIGGGGDRYDGQPKEVFIAADEFNQFVGTGNIDFLSMLGDLWDYDDEAGTYKYRLKNSKSVSIYQPTVTILGGNTHESLQDCFPAQAIGQGFLSRLLLIHSEPSGRKITFPKIPSQELVEQLAKQLAEIKTTVHGPARVTASASTALDMIYRSWPELEDYRFKSYSTRRFTHLLKLCLVVSAMRVSTVIDMEDVLLSNTILTWTERDMPKALGEFGKSKHSEAAQTIMSALYSTTKPLDLEALWRLVSRDLDKRTQIAEVIQGLSQADKIVWVDKKGFLAKHKPLSTKSLYVDYTILKENPV